jgi:type I restriction enzyme S subunit
MYYWFRSKYGKQLVDSLSRGAVRERILFNRLAAGRIELPDYETQLRASQRMMEVRPVIESITKELEATEVLPASILREAFPVEA